MIIKQNKQIFDCKGTFMYNNARHLQLYYAVPCMGCVINPLNIRLHPNDLSYIIQHADVSVVFIFFCDFFFVCPEFVSHKQNKANKKKSKHTKTIQTVFTFKKDRFIFVDEILLAEMEKLDRCVFRNVTKIVICGKNMQVKPQKKNSENVFFFVSVEQKKKHKKNIYISINSPTGQVQLYQTQLILKTL